MNEPYLLLIETSGRGGFVALAHGASLYGVRTLEESRRHARDLSPMTAELLRERNLKPRDLQGVFVGVGPGSYTGLRVGVMAAKTLAYATGCALLGLQTFAVIAEQAPPEIVELDVLADGQQEKVYVQHFRRAAGVAETKSALTIQPLAEWLNGRGPATAITGPAVDLHEAKLGSLPLVEASLRVPTPQGFLAHGLRRFRAGERDDLWSLEPIYGRASAAEQQWKQLGRP